MCTCLPCDTVDNVHCLLFVYILSRCVIFRQYTCQDVSFFSRELHSVPVCYVTSLCASKLYT